MRKLAIDVVSDVVCPWCLIGTRRLDQALASFDDVELEITMHPFLLDPTTPVEGEDLRERLTRKYGVPAASMFARVEEAARESGIPLDFEKVRRSVNTIAAHTLMRHAAPKGTQLALSAALFDAYFLEGKDVGDHAVLAAIATQHGFAEDETIAILSDEGERAMTQQQAAAMSRQGISGVPFFIFDRKLAFSGAQSVETMKQVIAKALSDAAGADAEREPA